MTKLEMAMLETIIAAAKKRTKVAPEGRLRLSVSHGCRQYRQTIRGKDDKHLSPKDDMVTIRALAQKDYDARMLKVALKEQYHLKLLASLDPGQQKQTRDKQADALAELATKGVRGGELSPLLVTTKGSRPMRMEPLANLAAIKEVYEALPEERKKLVIPAVWPDEEYAKIWRQSLLEDEALLKDGRVFSTNQGEMVRSKSEVIIANKLHAAEVPYLYERPLELGSRTVHPDFVVLNPATRQEWVWEHFGMMDDADYLQGVVQKLKAYSQCGIVPGHGLITTFESSKSPLDIAAVDAAVSLVLGA